MGWDESFEILSQTGIACINVRSPDPTRHEYGIDLRDESQQVIVRVGPAESRVVLLALFVKVRVAINEKTPSFWVESQIRTNDDANVVQVVSLNRMNRSHFLERVA
jgi:hypothetical protein